MSPGKKKKRTNIRLQTSAYQKLFQMLGLNVAYILSQWIWKARDNDMMLVTNTSQVQNQIEITGQKTKKTMNNAE